MKDTQPMLDQYCQLCGGHGHTGIRWNFMAKLLKAQESPKTIVTKWKEKLQENFKQEQQKHWERKLKK
jgi:hypothetical protein